MWTIEMWIQLLYYTAYALVEAMFCLSFMKDECSLLSIEIVKW